MQVGKRACKEILWNNIKADKQKLLRSIIEENKIVNMYIYHSKRLFRHGDILKGKKKCKNENGHKNVVASYE